MKKNFFRNEMNVSASMSQQRENTFYDCNIVWDIVDAANSCNAIFNFQLVRDV